MNMLIAGCGYVGLALSRPLVRAGHHVIGLRRQTTDLPADIEAISADLTSTQSLLQIPAGVDTVFYTAAAGGTSDPAYRAAYVEGVQNLLSVLQDQEQPVQRFFFASSTSVYGQSSGEWVDEQSPIEPTSFAGQRIVAGEQLVLHGPYPATIVRFGGIYGPGRTRLIEMVRNGEACYTEDPPLYTNRIHRDDCAGVLVHLMAAAETEPVYVAVDDDPADQKTVFTWLATRLDAAPPQPRSASPTAPARTRGNKRCRNARLKASGYVFRYPTFREGYATLLEEQDSTDGQPSGETESLSVPPPND